MDVVSIGLGLTIGGAIGLWGMLVLSRNGDLREERLALDLKNKGETKAHETTTATLDAERESHDDTAAQLKVTEKLLIELARKVEGMRAGGVPVGDDFSIAGDVLDRVLANKNSGRADDDDAAAVSDKATPSE